MDYGWLLTKRFEAPDKSTSHNLNIQKNEYLIQGTETRQQDVCRSIETPEPGADFRRTKFVAAGQDRPGQLGDRRGSGTGNGKRLIETARLYGIELYLMTKQFGRNPWLAEKLLALGYSGIVVVDYKEARVMRRAGLPVAHQGHLVQIPCHQVADAVEQGTDVITVFTLDKAREVSAAAVKAGRVQSVLLKVYSDDDFLYPGQESGFVQHSLHEVVAEIKKLPGLHLAGLTHFPCLLWDEAAGKVLPTPNLHTLIQAREQLAKSGIAIEQLNAPSATSCTSLPLLAEYGVTHAEPGHALTGTIPANQQGDQPERIAMLWLSEISHHSVATATATAAVTTVVVMRNMRWCLRQKIKRLLKPISKLWMTAVSTTPCRWQASFR